MSEVTLTGIASNIQGEDRALAHLKVEHNGSTYDWLVYVPIGTEDLQSFVESIKQSVIAEVESKELVWSNLEPKTKTRVDPLTGEEIQTDILKEEIVRPSVPDYYAMRRNEYPSIGDQLDALWKGSDSQAFAEMISRIAEVKSKYPKP